MEQKMEEIKCVDASGSGVEENQRARSARRRFALQYARRQGVEIWDDLVRQYDEGIIPTLKELSQRIRETTGVTVSLGTLSRHLNSGEDRKKRKNRALMARGYEDITKEEILGPAPTEVKYRSLSRKLQNTLLTIGEEGGVRRYNRVTVSVDGSKEYFRCAFCYKCKRKKGTGAVAYLTVCEGRIVGNLHPQHHEDCQPMSEERAAIEALDRQSRRDVRTGKKAPKDAHADGFERALELARSSGGPPSRKFNMPAMFPLWSKVGHSYNRARKHALCRTLKNGEQGSADVEHDTSFADDFIHGSRLSKNEDNAVADDIDEIIDPISSSPPPQISPAISTESINVHSNIIDDPVYEPLNSTTAIDDSCSLLPVDGESLSRQIPSRSYASSKDQISFLPTTVTSSSFRQTYSASSVNRHWLVRNPHTGRITIRKCAPSKVFFDRAVPRRMVVQSSDIVPTQSSTENAFHGRTVKGNDDYLHADLKRETASSPVEDMEGVVSSSSTHTSMPEFSCMKLESHSSYDAQTTQEVPSEKCVNTLSAIEALLDKAATTPKDEYDRIGESVADCMRKVCEGNVSVGVKFKCELLQMMAKYEMMAIGE